MGSTRIAVAALAVALVALALSFFQRSQEARTDRTPSASVDTAQIDLQQRTSTLEEQLTELQAEVDAIKVVAPTPPAAARELADQPPVDLSDLESRVASVERALERGSQDRSVRLDAFASKDADEEDRRSLEEWRDLANDPNATPEEMLSSLRRLRGHRLEDGSDARLPVLAPMIQLAHVSPDGDVRADIWRQLDEVTDPSLMTALLDALANDPHPGAREEAAESLAPFLPDHQVEQALRNAMEFDEDEAVRRQAAASLSRRS